MDMFKVHTNLEHRHEPFSSFILVFSFVMNIMDPVRPSTLYMWYLIYPHFKTQTLTLVAQTVKRLPAMQEPHIRRNTISNHVNKCTDSFTSYREWAGSLAETLNSRFNSEGKPANQMFTVPMNVSAILVKVDLKIQSSV